MAESAMIRVEVAYALPDEYLLEALSVAAGTTVRQAVEASSLLQRWPELQLDPLKVVIWYKAEKWDTTLKDGDRIMLLRPLIADPREARRQRADRAKRDGRADNITGGRPNPLRRKEQAGE